MTRDWYDFKALHSNFAGARIAFENVCESLIRVKHPEKNVQSVKIKQGDGGIDIFIGNFGVESIEVFQCKFFLDNIGKSQKSQINNSFDKAINSKKYTMNSWTLCLPKEFDTDEHDWFAKWKLKKEQEYKLDKAFIKFMNGNAIIDLMKSFGIYNRIFKMEDSIKIAEIHAATVVNENVIAEFRDIEEKKLKLSIKPDLWLNGVGHSGYKGELRIYLNNKGDTAILLDFRLISDDILLYNHSFPFYLEKEKGTIIYGRKNGDKHIKHCEYEIDVYYTDKLENKYLTKIVGKGAIAKIIETKEIIQGFAF